VLFFFVVFFVMLEFPFFVIIYGKPDFWPMVVNLLGFALASCTYLAIGLFASSLTESQIASAMIGFFLVMFFLFVSMVSDGMTGSLGTWLADLSINKRLEDFYRGILDLSNVFFFVALSFTFIFLTIRRLEWKRW